MMTNTEVYIASNTTQSFGSKDYLYDYIDYDMGGYIEYKRNEFYKEWFSYISDKFE